MRYKDPELHYRVDIGLPSAHKSRSEQLQSRLKTLKEKRSDKELERLARNKQRNLKGLILSMQAISIYVCL